MPTDLDLSLAAARLAVELSTERAGTVSTVHVARLLAELNRARTAAEAVRAIHRPRTSTIFRDGACTACSGRSPVAYPCETVRALDGA